MREILFKAKRKDNGKWVEGYYATIHAGCLNALREPIKEEKTVIISHMKNSGMIFDEVSPETVCLYTGLGDKNKKKLFEWDVVRTKSGIGYINYGDGCFAVQDIKSKNNPAIDIVLNEGKIEIIGNIFDNPELLEVAE